MTLPCNPCSDRKVARLTDNGTKLGVSISNQKFQTNHRPSVTSVDPTERLRCAVGGDSTGRRLKIWSEKNCAWFQGTIIGYNERISKHRIQFDIGNQVKSFCLENEIWRYIDLIGNQGNPDSPDKSSTSRFLGVERCSEMSWRAYKSPLCSGNSFGSFASEKDAAYAYDILARRNGLPVNFDDEQVRDDEVGNNPNKVEKPCANKTSEGAIQQSDDDIVLAEKNNKSAALNHVIDDTACRADVSKSLFDPEESTENGIAALSKSEGGNMAVVSENKCAASNRSDDVAVITQVAKPKSSIVLFRCRVGTSVEKVRKF